MNPVFIVAVPRSGTTMLRMILNSHPFIYSGGETPWLSGNYESKDFSTQASVRCLFERMTIGESSVVQNMSHIDVEDVRNSIKNFLNELIYIQLKRAGKRIWVEKTPDNIIQVPFLKEIFPEAKFIHIMRDGRDVALSTIKVNWKTLHYFIENNKANVRFINLRQAINRRILYKLPKRVQDILLRISLEPSNNNCSQAIVYPIANTYYNALYRWKKWNEIYMNEVKKLDANQISIKYEDLLLRPNDEFAKIFNFINVEWDQEILNYSKYSHDFVQGDVGSTSAQKFKSIEPNNVYKWKKKLTPWQKKLTKKYFDDYLQLMGYQKTT